jgi:hypothetical protein
MSHPTLFAFVAAALLGLGGAAAAQGERPAGAIADPQASPTPPAATARAKRRDLQARRDAANSTSRDLSDSAGATVSSGAASGPKPKRPAGPRDRAGAATPDLSDSSPSPAAAPLRPKRTGAARGSDGSNATSRDLSDGTTGPKAAGK